MTDFEIMIDEIRVAVASVITSRGHKLGEDFTVDTYDDYSGIEVIVNYLEGLEGAA